MCRFLINEVVLGKRSIGFECYSAKTQDIIGMTARQVKDSLTGGKEIKGFRLYPSGEVKTDREFCRNYMVKSGIGNLSPKFETDCIINIIYTVVGRAENGFEVVSSRFFRGIMQKDKLKLLYEMGAVNGVYIGADGEIRLIGETEEADTNKVVSTEKTPKKTSVKK